MPAPSNRPIHAALIPWVIVLVVLIGLNAITPDYSGPRKTDSSGETGFSQALDVLPVPGNFANPLVFLIPQSTCRAPILVSRGLSLEVFAEDPWFEFPHGAVKGRAPPAGSIA